MGRGRLQLARSDDDVHCGRQRHAQRRSSRGFAPKAGLLPIKVGRSNGRIPESAILAGLRWLLKDNNWRRYDVRVVNISVGGDSPINWEESELSLAAEQLSYHGVLVAAASGNSGRAELLPPAQSPSVLTVGGYDDRNRRWSLLAPEEIAGLGRYHHNFGKVTGLDGGVQKPEILGLAHFVPSPILPGTPTFREMHAIDALRRTLSGADDAHAHELLDHWQRVMHVDDPRHPEHEELEAWAARFDSEEEQSLHEIWRALRKRMNAHKWVHPITSTLTAPAWRWRRSPRWLPRCFRPIRGWTGNR